MPSDLRDLVASITADLCLEKIGARRGLGVFVENLPPLDPQTFLKSIEGGTSRPLRVALLGSKSARAKKSDLLEVTTDPTEANKWRNSDDARSRPCITLVLGPAPKLNSLRTAVPPIGPDDLRAGVVARGINLLDSPERRAFWSALGDRRGEIPLQRLLAFLAVAMDAARSHAALLDREPRLVSHLQLLEQPALFRAVSKRVAGTTIRRNLELIERIAALTATDRRRLLQRVDGEAVDADAVVSRKVLRFERSHSREDLEGLTVEDVTRVLKAPVSSTVTKGKPRERLDGDALALDLLLHEDGRGLGVASKRFQESVEPDEENAISPDEITVGARQVLPRVKAGTAQASGIFGRLLSVECWGGLVLADEASDLVSALRMVGSGDIEVSPFRPAETDSVEGMLKQAVNTGLVPASTLQRWEAYASARSKLLTHAAALTDHPLLAMEGSADLKKAAQRTLDAYGEALEGIEEAAEALKKIGSVEPAKRLRAKAICLDIAFVKSKSEFNAIAAPTHPFHLWRWLTLGGLIAKHRADLLELGQDVLEPLVTDPPASSPHLVLSPFAVDSQVDRARTFVATGSFGALPLYAEPTARQLGKFRAQSLSKISERFVRLMPHASLGLRVLLVDPPSISGALEDLVDLRSAFDEEERIPLHVSVARTRPAREATDEEDDEIESVAQELRERGGSLEVLSDVRTLKDLSERVTDHAPHIAVIFDPGEGQELRIGVTGAPALSPLLLPRAYRYDPFDDRLDVIMAGEASAFSRYHGLFCETLDVPVTDFVGRRSGASRSTRDLEGIARGAIWLVVVDQGLEPTLRVGGATRIDCRTDGGRDLVTFTAHTETVEDLVADALRAVGLRATEETVKRTLRELIDLSGEALLWLAKPQPSASLADLRVAKGLIGVLATARWYGATYPGAVLVSLDDPSSRRWVLGVGGDDRHGDLLGLRQTKDGVVIEAIEVKAHGDEEAGLKFSGGKVEGKAVIQVDQTLATLKTLFATTGSTALNKARLDVLRDQLYRAIAARPYAREQRGRLVRLLEELFASGPATYSGLIARVSIASGVASVSPAAPTPHKSQAGNFIGVVDLQETEVAGASPPVPKAAERPAGTKQDKGVARMPVASPARGESADTPTSAPSESRSPGDPLPAPEDISVLIGHSATGDEVVWSPHRADAPLNNFGLLVTGDPGSGKTQLLRAVVAELSRMGLPVCIFDFKNDYSDGKFSGPLGLRVHNVDREGLPFNPLALVADDRGEAQPIRQIHTLVAILKRIFGLGDQQAARLKRAMEAAFEERGISPSARHRVDGLGPAPSFADVLRQLPEDEKSESLLNRVSPLFDLNLFPASDAVKMPFEQMLRERVVLDLHELPSDPIKAAMAEFIIVRLHGYVLRGEQPRVLRRLLVLDEAWRVAESERLQELAREGRAFGVGIAIGTQFPGDLPENLAGNLATQLLLQNSNVDHRKVVARTLCGSASGPQAAQIIKQIDMLKKHEGFLRNQHYSPYVLVETLPHYRRQ